MLADETSVIEIIGTVKTIDHETSGTKVLLERPHLERITAANTPRYIRIKFAKKFGAPDIGDRISTIGVLMPPPPPVAPHLYDFQRHMYFKGIGATGYAVREFQVLQKDETNSIQSEHLREYIKSRVLTVNGSPQAKAVLIALLTGERKLIPDDLWEDIRKSGIAHLLAISGLHIGLVAGLIFFVLRAILAAVPYTAIHWPVKKICAAASFAAIVFYCWLVGAPVSAERAVLMTGIVLFAILIDRVAISLRLAAFAAVIVLLWAPEMLFTPGFQMSFAAVTALIAFYEYFSGRISAFTYGRGLAFKIATYFIMTLITTIVASLATAPFALYHFHRVALLPGLLANMVAVPITALFVMPLGLLGMVLMPMGIDTFVFSWAMHGIDIILNVAAQTSNMDNSVMTFRTWPHYALIVMVLGALWMAIWQGWLRWLSIPVFMIAIFFAMDNNQPDILISAEGKLIAIHAGEGRLSFSNPRAERFTKTSWHNAYGRQDKLYWPDQGQMKEIDIRCDYSGCIYTRNDIQTAFPKSQMAAALDCQMVPIVIAPEFYELPAVCNGIDVISRSDIKKNGAHALYFDGQGYCIETVRDVRGMRPWTIYGR